MGLVETKGRLGRVVGDTLFVSGGNGFYCADIEAMEFRRDGAQERELMTEARAAIARATA